jgi:predicted CXXCH cytochrome family protein
MLRQIFILIKARSLILVLSSFWVTSLALFINLAIAAPILADGPSPDYTCKKCHVGRTGKLTLPSGETLSLGVDIDVLGQSVHGTHAKEEIYCTDCHRSRERYLYPHQPNPAQTRSEFASDVSQNCRRCHEPIEKHNPGHLLARDNAKLPTCTDCHGGGHNTTSADTLTIDPVATCLACHQTYDDPKMEAVHQEVIANLDSDQTCQTCHTDTPIYPADVQCKACHGLLESEMILASGDTVSLYVDAAVVDDSVHGRRHLEDRQRTALLCTDCHRDQARYGFPHAPVTPFNTRLFSIEMSNLCQECHQDIYDRQQDSSHAEALNNGKIEAATCADCHGSHAIQVPNEPRGHISQTCAQCHAAINQEYATSMHGAALLGEDNPDVPVCIDCHGVHDIEDPTTALFRIRSPRLCAGCHADEALMNKYDISTDVFNTYVADFHGTTVELFEKQSPDHETNKAVCYDCHGVHNILPTEDEHAQVIKDNLLATCRQCHPDADANFPDAWTSHFKPSLEHNPLIYLVDLFYAILIPVTIGGFVFFIITDVYRQILKR